MIMRKSWTLPNAKTTLRAGRLHLASIGLLLMPGITFAQEQVVLRVDDELEIVGTDIALEDGAYAIQTALGRLLIDVNDVECIGALCPDLDAPEVIERPTVTLREKSGSMELTGQLVALEDGAYVLDTALGELRLSQDLMICDGPGCPTISETPSFVVQAGGVTMESLLPALLKGFADTKEAKISFTTNAITGERIAQIHAADETLVAELTLRVADDDSVLTQLDEGVFDVGFTQRRITPQESAIYTERGFGELRGSQHEALLALDAVTVFVHPTNQIRNLAPEDIQRIWSGEITNWQQLGGRDMPIRIHDYANAQTAIAQEFRARILPSKLSGSTPVFATHETSAGLVESVVSDRAAIGVASRATALAGGGRLISLIRSCGLLAAPSNFGVKIGDYPAGRSIYAYTRPDALHPVAKEFVEWSKSSAAQEIIGDAGFANADLEKTGIENMGMMLVHTAAVEPDFDGNQFSTLMRELRGADRLSIAFRFRSGSSILDPESIDNLGELAKRIEANEFEGQEILLVGFADSVGDSNLNTILAEARSQAVLEILERELPRQTLVDNDITPLSFGEQLPMACNDVAEGRDLNRRVEVWTRLASAN
ncbi:phosphate ABC transporter substrate-binding/OmpA family protein [Loktanella sp. S4079]|uniref:phosphate ABC transporter substrate-binding/OmpA family protein n=1 Tax=Loktanella sp. S4079 TaxID=579483 RepID=UPI0005F9B2C4|nr:phosphate ABC transporter substrate-binding/OmpA family protein [Loktanella sp. S4079]KJZ20682.1 hypothetical protein TW80_07905 [Loktanella sp. S4079]